MTGSIIKDKFAAMYLIAALILISIVLTARAAGKWRLPLVVIALAAGIIFGSDVSGLVYFDNPVMAKKVADFALIFVLFAGGFGTRRDLLKLVFWPAMTLSTIGVVITAAITTLIIWLIPGGDFISALLLGVVISSTDAATVFSILRSRSLNPRLSAITEIESATNDPMAIILTVAVVHLASAGLQQPANIVLMVIWQLLAGIGSGIVTGQLGVLLFRHIKTIDRGFFYLFLIGVVFLSYGAADILGASGIISAFFAGYILGDSNIPYKKTIASFLEALATIANVGIFVMLGLLVFPKELGSIWKEALILFAVLTFLARPAAVFLCTIFGKFTLKDRIFISWSGLRGAVPIVLATYPYAAGIDAPHDIFNVVFLAVAISIVVQGSTISKLAGWLNLTSKAKPKPSQVMELVTLGDSDVEMCELHIDETEYSGSIEISKLNLPQGTTITMINRNEEIIAPQGSTEIKAGDVLYVLLKNTNIDIVNMEISGKLNLKRT